MYVVEKKITGWIVLQYKIIITIYQNIAINIFSIKHEHAHEVVVKNGGSPVSSILLLLY
jgi:ArsR family metal-binding transcriptional regulator